MRSNLQNNRGEALDIVSLLLGSERQTLSGSYDISDRAPVLHFLDAGGAFTRNVNLPTERRGRIFGLINNGAAGSLSVRRPVGTELVAIDVGEAAFIVCSGTEYKILTQSVGDALDPTEVSSPDGSITVAIVGDAITIVVNESNVDHDALGNYVANKHIDHTSVSVATSATSGLTGGGDISATRNLSLAPASLNTATPVLADLMIFGDASASDAPVRATFSDLNGILNHNSLLNYVANEHVNHTSVSINAGTGLTGGGDISASRTLSLDINGLAADSIVTGDFIAFYDISGSDHNKITAANFISNLSLLTTSAGNAAYQPLDSTLTAFAAYNTAGLLTQTAADTFTGRTITGPAAGITVSNGNGVGGNPTLALANDLAAVEGLSANGIATRTATDTWAARTITGTSNKITVTNGDGVAGNPTLTVGSDILDKTTTATLAAGYPVTSNSLGTITGANQTITPDVSSRGQAHCTLNGSSLTGTLTFAAPSNGPGWVLVEVVNGGSGAVGATLSTSGYTKVTGDTYATTNGNKYHFWATKSQNYSHLHIQALQ